MKIQINKSCIVLSILLYIISGVAYGKKDILPSTPKDIFSHAKLAYSNKDYKSALKLFKKLQKEFPNSENAVRGWEYLAQCENKLGNQFAAFEAYQQIWDNHKDFGRLAVITRNQMQIGNYYLNVKRYKFAIEIYQQILENAPFSETSPAAQFSLAEAYIGQKDYYSGKYELKKVIEDYPTSQLVDDAAYKLGYVNFLESEGHEYDQTATEEAVIYFRRFIHNFPSSPKVADARRYIKLLRERIAASIFRKGEFYYNIKASKAANIQFKSVINRYPDTKYADLARNFLLGIKAETGESIVAKEPSKSFVKKKKVEKIDSYDRPYTDYKMQKQQKQLAKRKESQKNKKIKELLNKVGKEELHEYVKTTYYIPEIKKSRLMATKWKEQKVLLAELSTKKSDVEKLQPKIEKIEFEESVEITEEPKKELPEEIKENIEVETKEKTEEIIKDVEPIQIVEEINLEAEEQAELDELSEEVEEILTESDSIVIEEKKSEIEELDIKLKEVNIPKPKTESKKESDTFDAPETKKQKPKVAESKPEADESKPEADEQKPEVDESKPEVDEQKPEVDESKPEVDEQKPEEAKEEVDGWKVRKITGAGKIKRAQYDTPQTLDGKVTHEMLLREFKSAYDYIQKGEATQRKGLYLKAKIYYEKALEKYLNIQEKSPTWEIKIINYRINDCREKLRGIE